jgi:hypothetical protein
MPRSVHYKPKVCIYIQEENKIVSGQLRDVSGHHQTHLGRVIGQSGKKQAVLNPKP